MDNEITQEPQTLTIQEVEGALSQANISIPSFTPFPPDNDATWVYWTNLDSVENGIPDEWIWERLRIRRNSLLEQCDWRVVPDAAWDTAPWIAYRQALRDLPTNTQNPRQAIWPIQPE